MKRIFYIFTILLLLLTVNNLCSQSITLSTANKKAAKSYRLAESSYRSREYSQALDYLESAVKKDRNFIEAWLLMGDVYTERNNHKKAIDAFQNAIRIDSSFFPRAYYFIGNLAFEEGDYKKSEDYLSRYLHFNDEDIITRRIGIQRLRRAQFADFLVRNPVSKNPLNIGKQVNTDADEYVNFVNEDFTRLILTRKSVADTGVMDRVYYQENFFAANGSDNNWEKPELIELPWQKGRDLGGMNLSVDGRRMYFTGCDWPIGFGSCDIYFSFRKGNNWEAPINLGSSINSIWWDSQPSVSSDGKRIYFSSKRAEGKGGSDIWMTVRLDNGQWSQPINLGDSINTAGNEMSPFIHPDGKTLYFSSDGHHGLGGSDLFISRKDDVGRWSKAKNLGYPINSSANEINLFMSFDGSIGYLSSDRSGGKGKFDIYDFKTPAELKPLKVYFVKGKVIDQQSNKPLEANVQLTNLGNGLLENECNSDPATGEFLMVLHPGEEYAFNITKAGYLFYSEHFSSTHADRVRSVSKTFELEPLASGKQLVLNNVFFEFDRSDLNSKSYTELDKLFYLLKENPELHVMIGGHTDSIGDEDYNKKLSEERAKVVYQYLVNKGISGDRIEYKGFGASNPVADNKTEKGRALNRRTVVTIR